MLYNTCIINKLEDRRVSYLINFVYVRTQSDECLQRGGRELRRYDAPILKEIKSNNNNFERSTLFQGALNWNWLDTQMRSKVTISACKQSKKCKLNTFSPY